MLSDFIQKVTGTPESYHKKQDYEFGETLGAGAFGVVRKALRKSTDEPVAVKLILRKKIKGKEDSVMSELDMLNKLHHPHIVRLVDWFESRDKIYIVTELCTGGELFDRIVQEGKYTEKDAARAFKQISEAIKYLHDRNIVHRDIKPENLLYSTQERNSRLVLCDFGIAKSLRSELDLITTSAGSLGYAAPEIFSKSGHGKPCDIWSLGVVLFTLLCGYSPFTSDTVEEFIAEVQPLYRVRFPKQYWGHISLGAKRLVDKMIEFDTAIRPTIDDVLSDPWVEGQTAADEDILPSIKPRLNARMRWRLAFEKIRLSKRIQLLGPELYREEDEESGTVVQPISPALRFQELVLAAQRNKELLQKANEEP